MSSSTDAIFPTILWAQRPDYVLVTVPLQDATDVSIALPDNGRVLSLSATAGSPAQRYHCAIALFRDVSSEESRHVTLPRQIELRLKKKGPDADADDDAVALSRAWPRLTRDKAKNRLIQVDWSRWKDDDDEAGEGDDGDGEFGMDAGDIMSQMMMAQQQSQPYGDEPDAMEREGLPADDDFDDLPPLEE